MMHLIIHMFNTSMIPYISLDQYLNPNLYTIPNTQNMRFFCCPVYLLTLLTFIKQIEENNMDLDQTATTRAVRSGSTLFVGDDFKIFQRATKQKILFFL